MQTRQSKRKTDAYQNKRARDERKSGWVGADEKNKWSVSGEVLQRGGEDGESSDACLHPAMIRVRAGWFIFQLQYWVPGKREKKIYIPLNYWGFYFERRMWLWVCGCVGGKEWPSDVAIMKLKMSVLILILFLSPLIAPLFSSPFCGKCTEYTDIIKKKKKREKLMRNSCRHIHQASFSDVYYVSVVMLLCKLLQTSETLFLNCMIPFAYTFENLKQQEKIS